MANTPIGKFYISHEIYHMMAELKAQVRKWGDSLAVIIPKEIAARERIRVKDRIRLIIEKELDLSDLFGAAKGKLRGTPQELKNESRKGWD